jgi:hypothetical protein
MRNSWCQRGGVVNALAWRASSLTGAEVRILSLALCVFQTHQFRKELCMRSFLAKQAIVVFDAPKLFSKKFRLRILSLALYDFFRKYFFL